MTTYNIRPNNPSRELFLHVLITLNSSMLKNLAFNKTNSGFTGVLKIEVKILVTLGSLAPPNQKIIMKVAAKIEVTYWGRVIDFDDPGCFCSCWTLMTRRIRSKTNP